MLYNEKSLNATAFFFEKFSFHSLTFTYKVFVLHTGTPTPAAAVCILCPMPAGLGTEC